MRQYQLATGLLKKRKMVIKGFSLIEVAIAIVVLGLVAGTVVSVFAAGAKAARKTQQQTVAYNLARAVLEQYSDWTSLDQLDGLDGIVTNQVNGRPAVTLNNIIYTPTLTISDGPISPAQLKLLNATIDWTDGSIARNISVSTLKANY